MSQLIPFRELFSSIPICTSEFNVADQFLAICDGLYEDYFQSENQSGDKEFIRLLSLKLSSEIYSCIHGQSFNSYAEFKNFLWSIITPEISLEDAILSLYNMKMKPRESIRDFGYRVESALQIVNTTYSFQFNGNLPASLRASNIKIAIDIFANSIKDEETRILLLTRNFPNLISAIHFAENRLNSYEFYYDDSNDFQNQMYTNTQDLFEPPKISQNFDFPSDDFNYFLYSQKSNLPKDLEKTQSFLSDPFNESSFNDKAYEDITFPTYNILVDENSSFEHLSNSENWRWSARVM